MGKDFQYDGFLSHSAKDNTVVRPLEERLRADGLKVRFDEWEIKPGDGIPGQIDEGLEHSRMLLLCRSSVTPRSKWVAVGRSTALCCALPDARHRTDRK